MLIAYLLSCSVCRLSLVCVFTLFIVICPSLAGFVPLHNRCQPLPRVARVDEMPAKPDVYICSERCRFERASPAGLKKKRRYFDTATNGSLQVASMCSMLLTVVVSARSSVYTIRCSISFALKPVYCQMTLTTGMLMDGKMSVGVRNKTNGVSKRRSSDATTNV